MTYLTPRVYVEEVPSASKPIEGVATSIAAFVGFAEEGPPYQPILRVAAGLGLVALVVLVVRHRRAP
jgi:phage tail sheath protein FI